MSKKKEEGLEMDKQLELPPYDADSTMERFTDPIVSEIVLPSQRKTVYLHIYPDRNSPGFTEGREARKRNELRDAEQDRQWLYGWDDADWDIRGLKKEGEDI